MNAEGFTLLDHQLEIVETIPHGYKDNVFCSLDNSENILRKQNSQASYYADDCGSWDTHSARSMKTDLIYMPNGKKTYTPYNPQLETVVTLYRFYISLKRYKSFKKRVSWFTSLPDTLKHRLHIAIVEYVGKCPRTGEPHGNAKLSTQEFVRTDKIKHDISLKQSTSTIYRNMVLNNPESAPRDSHQIRNIASNNKKQHKSTLGNVADQIVHVMSMVNKDDFVKEVFHTEGNNKPPSAICYTKEQFNDMAHFIKSGGILGIDRTFNLRPVFVTNFVYKNNKVVRKETGGHPIFIGPLFLHWEGSFLSYHTFLSHIKARFDDEGGLTKALDSVFPNATRRLCTKHIKDNVSDHLKNKIGSNDKERNEVLDSIFGSTGLITAQDQDEFNEKATNISACYPNFNTYFQSRLKERLYEYVLKPRNQLQHVDLWTNNNCESINHVFRTAINWKPPSLPELVKTLHELVKLEFADLRRALYSQGNYLLFGYFKRHQLLYQCWLTKTPDQKDRLFQKLMKDSDKSSLTSVKAKTVTSTLCDLTMPLPQRLAKEPCQTKRPRVARTQPRF
ncbi:unnamed protein product [Mytilus coruscus]|uniref:MULE transposase domain-containing protein n=1 Tax=Mytilus coruscus TaxID=42192 RepID=A0A6J8EZ61_MYTCO|nr:unnamed protein product [Mytilus coruscus]